MNFHRRDLTGLIDGARVAAPAAADVSHALDPEGPRLPRVGEFPPRRIPVEDIVGIGRSEPRPEPVPVRVVPRISRRRLAFRAFLVLALIGEVVVSTRMWPRAPIAVPDASGPRNMIA